MNQEVLVGMAVLFSLALQTLLRNGAEPADLWDLGTDPTDRRDLFLPDPPRERLKLVIYIQKAFLSHTFSFLPAQKYIQGNRG